MVFRFKRREAQPNLMRQVLDHLIEGSYLAAIFLVPLWFSYWFPTYNIFEMNKICLFQILLFLLFFFVVLRLIYYPITLADTVPNFFKRYWLAPTVFIVGLCLSLFFSSNPALSFYGSLDRSMGLKSYLLFFLWFILVVSSVVIISSGGTGKVSDNIRRRIRRIVVTAVISGTLVSLYGILQILNIDFLTWPEAPYLTGRTFSSFGQPNFLASWLLFVIPLSLYLFFSTRRHWCKFFYFLALAAQLACLFLTGSRGGLVALILAGAAILVWLFFLMKWSKRKKITVSVIFLMFTVVSLAGLDFFSQGRVRDLAKFDMGSSGARINLYRSAVDAISSRPLFGYGIENEREVFIQYYSSDWGIYGQVSQSADRAHNIFLDILLSSGIYGLALYGILYGHFFKISQNGIKNSQQRFFPLTISFGLAAYLFSLFFSFTIVTGEMYIWLFFALLTLFDFANEIDSSQESDISVISPISPSANMGTSLARLALTFALVIMAVFPVYESLQSLVSDYYFNKIYIYASIPDYEAILRFYDKLEAQNINPVHRAEYDNYLGDKLTNIFTAIDSPVIKSAFQNRLQALVKRLPEQGYLNLYAQAKIFRVLGEYQKSQECLNKIIELTPHWPLVYLEQANLSEAQGDTKGLMVAYYLTLLNLPDSSDPRLNDEHLKDVLNYKYFVYKNMAAAFLEQKDSSSAEKYYQLAYKNKPDDFTLLKKIADTYYLEGNLSSAIKYNLHGFERSTQDYNWPLALAILYHESGNNRQALDYVEQALKLKPNNELLKQLKTEYAK